MTKKGIAIFSRLAGGLILLIGTASVAQAQCWVCVHEGYHPLDSYRCVSTPPGPGTWAYCNDFGETSYPCDVSGACEPMLAATVATVRPDGIMTRAIGLAQLIAPLSWLQPGRALDVALAGIFPASSRDEMPMSRILDAPNHLFSESFHTLPNSGVASSTKCEGYAVSRSYTSEQAAMLRRESGTFTI